jgi:argininosuccinate synthase
MGFAYKMSAEKAYSTDSNLLGATHEAKDLEQPRQRHQDRQSDHGRAVLARRLRRQGRKGRRAFEEGQPVALNGQTFTDPVRCSSKPTPSAAGMASA